MIDNYSFAGKKAIIRVDFNVPLGAQYEVTDDTRIRGALPTIKKVLQDGGSAILMSHLGRPKSGPEEKFSLKHIIPVLSAHLGVDVQFADDCVGEAAQKEKPDTAVVAVRYQDHWFYIAHTDHKSKQAFSLLAYLFQLQSPQAATGAPLLTVPTG